ncbi:energy transducer TonB [Pedobacter jeongneungensis]|uniref:energy transducer TonB n=1 Tax=Pedobacter jeongneungensis TaxID=947309 RepID=UPI000468FAC5|nr:energy transducer TonB [Pedobacter jeongneungensis]
MAQKSDTLITYNFGDNYYKAATKAAEMYKVYKKDSTWLKNTFNAKQVLIRTESFGDRKLKKLNGEYFEYENGNISLKGLYRDNKKIGLWTSFDADGKLKETKVYDQDLLNGGYNTYWKNGTPKTSGNYTDDKKTGEWKINYENGKLALKELYDAKNKVTDSSYLDMDGEPVAKADVTTEPSFPGGMKKFYMYLGKSIRYPADARNTRAQGKVYLSFLVSSNGKIEDIKVISAPHTSLAEEAIKVLQESPDWIPATLFGKPISVPYNININFTIS